MVVSVRALGVVVGLCCASCITPPLIAPAGRRAFELSSEELAMHAEKVEVDVGDGEKLRGIFVPGEASKPVVLHFLASGMSVSTGAELAGLTYDLDRLFAWFAQLGWASLALDYRGVGASDGERDAAHLREDALAAWNEALRRAGGDAKRVYVSGTSVGTLAAASLLERGIEPELVALAAPIRAETVARNWISARYGSIASALLAPWLRKPTEIDLFAAIRDSHAPIVVVIGARDELLPWSDRKLIAGAVLMSQGRSRCIELDGDHYDVVLAAWSSTDNGCWWPWRLDIGLALDGDDLWGGPFDDPRMCQVPPGRAFR